MYSLLASLANARGERHEFAFGDELQHRRCRREHYLHATAQQIGRSLGHLSHGNRGVMSFPDCTSLPVSTTGPYSPAAIR
jgi:hypothetical protein